MADAEPVLAHLAGGSTRLIDPAEYSSGDVFGAEMKRLFTSGFQFAGMRRDLAQDKDFVTVDLPGLAIVVQNFRGELRAFRNVCSHRFSRLQWEERGNRPLACRYHGWAYDAQGCPGEPAAPQCL